MRYKKDFDKRIRIANRHIQPGQYVYLDPRDGSKSDGKLGAVAEGPYRVQPDTGLLPRLPERSLVTQQKFC